MFIVSLINHFLNEIGIINILPNKDISVIFEFVNEIFIVIINNLVYLGVCSSAG